MGNCTDCVHYRRVKPASQLVSAGVSAMDAAVAAALAGIMEDERKQRDLEAEAKRQHAIAGDDDWGTRPVMSDFCGLREVEGVYLMSGTPAATAHRMDPGGIAADTGAPHSPFGFEISSAYAIRGILASRPRYLAYCGKLSSDDEFHVCALANPHHTCSIWESRSPKPAPAGPVPPNPPAPAAPSSDALLCAGDPPLTQYPHLSPEQRAWLGETPTLVAALPAAWQQMGAADREQFAGQTP